MILDIGGYKMSYQEIIIELLKRYDEKDICADWLTLEIINYLMQLRYETIEKQVQDKIEHEQKYEHPVG